jgi:predicted amidohydrolase
VIAFPAAVRSNRIRRRHTIRIAGLQLDIAWEDPEESFRRATILADEAAAAGARLLALPELFATGFSMRSVAMAAHSEAIRAFLSDLARRLGVWVLAGFAEPGRDLPANACSLFDPAGEEELRIHKVHPFSLVSEAEHYESGRTIGTTTVEGVRITPLICYDLRFVELFRAAAGATDCFVVIANWPTRRAHAWRTLIDARAIDCQAYVLGVNRVGDAEGHPHRGDTTLVDPMGKIIDRLAIRPGIVTGDVDPEFVAETRRRYSFLADRRPDVYDHL